MFLKKFVFIRFRYWLLYLGLLNGTEVKDFGYMAENMFDMFSAIHMFY
jgi:hypothetical protein